MEEKGRKALKRRLNKREAGTDEGDTADDEREYKVKLFL
jgi:hypothetical protein